jgi:hypothetical protein
VKNFFTQRVRKTQFIWLHTNLVFVSPLVHMVILPLVSSAMTVSLTMLSTKSDTTGAERPPFAVANGVHEGYSHSGTTDSGHNSYRHGLPPLTYHNHHHNIVHKAGYRGYRDDMWKYHHGLPPLTYHHHADIREAGNNTMTG